MKPSQLSVIYETRDRLIEAGTIPTSFREVLEDRLPIYCKPFPRQKPGKQRRTNQENKTYQRLKKAHDVYMDVFDVDPQILLPFIISVSPWACQKFVMSTFRQQHNVRRAIFFGNNAMDFLQEAAKRQEISLYPRFRGLMAIHFTQALPQIPPPGTGAASEDNWAFDHFNLDSIRDSFGARISDAVECSPLRLAELTEGPVKFTRCVRIQFPRWPLQDAIVWLNIGMPAEFAAILFPGASSGALPYIVSTSTEGSTSAVSVCQQQDNSMSNIEDHAHFTMKGASVKALASIFSQNVCDALESSQLRLWEKDRQMLDTTDCVSLQVWRSSPRRGIIGLRIEFKLGMDIVNDLSANNGTA